MNQQAEAFLAEVQSLANDVDDSKQVHVSRPHELAHLHVSGRASYTDNIPLVAGRLCFMPCLAPGRRGTPRSCR